MMYKDLVYQFAGGEGLDDGVNELTDSGKRYTVLFVVLGREPTEETFADRERSHSSRKRFHQIRDDVRG